MPHAIGQRWFRALVRLQSEIMFKACCVRMGNEQQEEKSWAPEAGKPGLSAPSLHRCPNMLAKRAGRYAPGPYRSYE